MSASAKAASRAAKRIPRGSSTGHASARPDRRPPLPSTSHSFPSAIVIGAQTKPIAPASSRNHPTAMLPHPAPTLTAAIKSP